jgi:hypothetical protein
VINYANVLLNVMILSPNHHSDGSHIELHAIHCRPLGFRYKVHVCDISMKLGQAIRMIIRLNPDTSTSL